LVTNPSTERTGGKRGLLFKGHVTSPVKRGEVHGRNRGEKRGIRKQ